METELLGSPAEHKFESGYLRELNPGIYEMEGIETFQYFSEGGPNLKPGSPGNLRHILAMGLQERFDFSGHGGSGPHINYDLSGADADFSRRALGDLHKLDLLQPPIKSGS